MKRIACLGLILLLSSCSSSVTVLNDSGGTINDRLLQIDRLSNTRVEILGNCFSSCTLLLSLPNVCVSPNSVFGFHGPSSLSGLPLPHSEWERVSREMASHYPPRLSEWFLREARYLLDSLEYKSGREIISYGVRECGY